MSQSVNYQDSLGQQIRRNETDKLAPITHGVLEITKAEEFYEITGRVMSK